MNWIEKFLAAVAASIAMNWMEIPHAEQALVVFMGLDLLIGVIGSLVVQGDGLWGTEFRAKKLLIGVLKKFAAVALVIASYWLQLPGMQVEFHTYVAWALCFYELTSLVESYARFGRVPPVFMKALDALRKATGEDWKVVEKETSTMKPQLVPPGVVLTVRKETRIEPVGEPAEQTNETVKEQTKGTT